VTLPTKGVIVSGTVMEKLNREKGKTGEAVEMWIASFLAMTGGRVKPAMTFSFHGFELLGLKNLKNLKRLINWNNHKQV